MKYAVEITFVADFGKVSKIMGERRKRGRQRIAALMVVSHPHMVSEMPAMALNIWFLTTLMSRFLTMNGAS